MKIGINTDGLGNLPLATMLDRVAELGLSHVEFGLGGWSSAPHVDIGALLASRAERDRLMGMLRERGLSISALNCSGNPLHPGAVGPADSQLARDTLELASLLDVGRIVMMSGLPAGNASDSCPNWITSSWPLEALEMVEWQWRERVLPYWRAHAEAAERHGLRLCIENHGRQCVYNVETYLRLREAIGPTIGMNFDPSHLIWMGGDPVAAIKALGAGHIYHVHGKDTRIEPLARVNGTLDDKHVTPVATRSWNFVPLGHGQSRRGWRDIVDALHSVGYDDVISIENEDYTLESADAIRDSVETLRFAITHGAAGRAA